MTDENKNEESESYLRTLEHIFQFIILAISMALGHWIIALWNAGKPFLALEITGGLIVLLSQIKNPINGLWYFLPFTKNPVVKENPVGLFAVAVASIGFIALIVGWIGRIWEVAQK